MLIALIIAATCLKYLGLLVSSYLGWSGLVHNYKDETTKALTAHGRRAVGVFLASSCITVLAAISEDVSKHAEGAKQDKEAATRLAESREQHHAVLLLQANSIPAYVRVGEYFRLWGNLLESQLHPSPVPNPTTDVTNARLLGSLPTNVLLEIETNVARVNGLIAAATWRQDTKALDSLLRFSMDVESKAFEPMPYPIMKEREIRDCYGATSIEEAHAKALRTVEEVIDLCDTAHSPRRLWDTESFQDRWARRLVDLQDLNMLWIYANVTDAPPEINLEKALWK